MAKFASLDVAAALLFLYIGAILCGDANHHVSALMVVLDRSNTDCKGGNESEGPRFWKFTGSSGQDAPKEGEEVVACEGNSVSTLHSMILSGTFNMEARFRITEFVNNGLDTQGRFVIFDNGEGFRMETHNDTSVTFFDFGLEGRGFTCVTNLDLTKTAHVFRVDCTDKICDVKADNILACTGLVIDTLGPINGAFLIGSELTNGLIRSILVENDATEAPTDIPTVLPTLAPFQGSTGRPTERPTELPSEQEESGGMGVAGFAALGSCFALLGGAVLFAVKRRNKAKNSDAAAEGKSEKHESQRTFPSASSTSSSPSNHGGASSRFPVVSPMQTRPVSYMQPKVLPDV